jgi:sugar lactone lactonase YvrE
MRCPSPVRNVLVRVWAGIALEALGLGLLGCGSSGSTGPSGTGSLTVTITAPAGATPSVTVSGPGGYRQSLSATQTLSGLAVGSYTVTAASVPVPNPIVATVYDGAVTGGTAVVSAGATATASVSYAARPGSGTLWVVNTFGPTVVAYTAAQLGASTGAAAATALATGGGPEGAAFDASGNLWIANSSNNTVVEYNVSQLGASGNPTPAVTLSATGAGSLNDPFALAFDATGNLWVANFVGPTVVEFTASQLGASASPTPAVTLSATAGSLSNPEGLAVDASGTLWVANEFNSTVVAFSPSQLGATGSPTPAVTLSATGAGSLSAPEGLAFDASGRLWVANLGNSTVVAFTASQFGANGSPTPAVTLSASGSSLNSPQGLAFDGSGNLWVTNGGGSTVVQFAASQLVVSGAPIPNVTLSGSSLAGPFGLAFDPPPAALPLK